MNLLNSKLKDDENLYLIVINRFEPTPKLHQFYKENFSDEQISLNLLTNEEMQKFFQQKLPKLDESWISWLVQEAGGSLAWAQLLGFHFFNQFNRKSSADEIKRLVKESLKHSFQTFINNYLNLSKGNYADIKNLSPYYQRALPRETASIFWELLEDFIRKR